jgi:hypothetical protein
MRAAYPTLTAEDTCEDFHRHEPRVFALAKALARAFQSEPISDEKIAWFLNDADAIVDDFGGPEWDDWTVAIIDGPLPHGLDKRLMVNGVEYVLPAAEWEPSVPVKRETWESWLQEDA